MRALVTVNYSTFAILWVLVFRFHEDLFDGLVAFEMYLDAILTTCLFNTFGDALDVLVVKHNVVYITSHHIINGSQQPIVGYRLAQVSLVTI